MTAKKPGRRPKGAEDHSYLVKIGRFTVNRVGKYRFVISDEHDQVVGERLSLEGARRLISQLEYAD